MKSVFRFLFTLLFFLVSNVSFSYWQQEVNYSIAVSLNDEKHVLNGFIEMEYINNSPDTLRYILIHLWPNAYKNEETALGQQLLVLEKTNFHYSEKKDKGYIDSLEFKVDQQSVKWGFYNNQIDIAKIELAQPLLSGQKITISTPFRVKIPLGNISRLGHISQSYQITQWYPKPAVYDAQGWHPLNYLNQGEFYSEYGSFNVKITLPENYVVGATGDLQGESGAQEKEWLLYKVKQTEEKIKKGKERKTATGEIKGKLNKWEDVFYKKNDTTRTASSKRLKTLHYYQQNVHDFAWFANKDWNVLKGEVALPYSQRIVDTWVMFTDAEAYLWQKSLTYLHDATYKYSLWNGEYPYNHVTAVDGSLSAGSGMEYPNITVIGESNSDLELENVIMHEVGHNWFYGILGSNERRNAWMDEGINSFNELRYMKEKYPNKKLSALLPEIFPALLGKNDPALSDQHYLSYIISARKGEDQKLDLSAEEFSNQNYGSIVYAKSAVIFNYLFSYLGKEKFDTCMKIYFNQWKFKHPQPKDLEQIFKENCKEDLSWFFNDLLKTDKVVDYKITEVKKESTAIVYDLSIKNTGEIKSPVLISGYNGDSLIYQEWYNGFEKKSKLSFPYFSNINKIVIDGSHAIPEINRSNNTIRTSGIFRRIEPIKLSFLGNLENPKYNNLYWLPTIGFNEHDRTMLGVALHNYQYPLKNVRYWINPMYSFANKIINGDAHLNFFIRKPLPFLSNIEAGVAVKQFTSNELGNFSFLMQKIEPSIHFKFKNRNANSPYSTELVTRMVSINSELSEGNGNKKLVISNSWQNYYEGKLICSKQEATNSFNITTLMQYSPNDFLKATINAEFKMKLNEKGKEFKIRFFGGKFFDETTIANQQFSLRGQRDEDYLYDNIVLARNVYNPTHVLSQQIYNTNGGFKFGFSSNDSRAKQWMATVNLTYDLPIPIKISGTPQYLFALFADIGTSDGILSNGTTSFYFDSGLQITIVRDIFEIYLPLFMSQELSDSYQSSLYSYNYFQKIRFLLNFNAMNPLNILKKL
jgi:hypothetical protein